MTTPASGELITLTPLRSRVGGSVGRASWIACILFVFCASIASGEVFRTIARFNNPLESGSRLPPLVQGIDGDLYGTTVFGGDHNKGTVFKVTPGGTLTTLHSFGVTDGANPYSWLAQAADGNFYGTTFNGGANNNCPFGTSPGCGTVFKVTPGGTLTTLYSFCSKTNCADGVGPSGQLVLASDGNFYGTTSLAQSVGETIFKITPGGTLTTLFTFDQKIQFQPALSFQGNDGNLYGITQHAGFGPGTVFKLTPSGTLATLYTFCSQTNCLDGATPLGLVRATDGNIYGTTAFGGSTSGFGYGTVFKITPGGTLTTLHSFNGTDGAVPFGLVQATDGNFYGAADGGAHEAGTIFKITPSGALTTLYSFCSQTHCTDGAGPQVPVQATNGTFYGTTQYTDPLHSSGPTIFSLCVGLGWFTEELPNNGKVGGTISILGTDLTGASSVKFNGTVAPFTIISSTQIQATVPSGATTGSVKVTIPSGTLTSNKRFRVLPQMTSFSPTSGPPGTVVTITGVSFSQTTRVGIGGVSASFTVVDDTTVTATVPTGAATGKKVVVTTRGGNVASSTSFTVE